MEPSGGFLMNQGFKIPTGKSEAQQNTKNSIEQINSLSL